jgi:hypothetical protein
MTTIINASASGLIETSDTSGVLQLQTNSTAALTIDNNQNVTCNSTGAITLPNGTTAQRPSSPTNGQMRYNTSNRNLEAYLNNGWQMVTAGAPITASYLIVAGGGGAGGSTGGGGGAGGFLTGSTTLTPGTIYRYNYG